VPHSDDRCGAAINDIFSRAEAFLLGRTTYDLFADYWPQVTDPDDPVAGKLNSLPRYVASRTRNQFDWNNSPHIRDVVIEVPAMQERFTGEVQVHGSAGLAQTLMEHDLIDEYRLLGFPVVIGAGKKWIVGGAVPATLKTERFTHIRAARKGNANGDPYRS
jgi:dihydrofolate reductase